MSEYEAYMRDWRRRVANGELVENVDSDPGVSDDDGMDELFEDSPW